MTRRPVVFVDFDGTVAKRDVGNEFFRTFGGAACGEAVDAYHAGAISAPECFRREAAACGRLDVDRAEAFARAEPIDPGFPAFVRFCRERGAPLHILSDGLDFYVDRILAAHGLAAVSRFTNRLVLGEPDTVGSAAMEVAFPYGDTECTRCACCKRNLMLTLAGDDDVIVYVGAGYSDRCPSQYADVVFAKNSLQTYCQRENISYTVYAGFTDVQARLAALWDASALRRRARAQLRRRAVFSQEP